MLPLSRALPLPPSPPLDCRRERDIKYSIQFAGGVGDGGKAAAVLLQPRFINCEWSRHEDARGFEEAMELAAPYLRRDIFQCPEAWLKHAKACATAKPSRMLFELLCSLDTESFGPKVCSEVLYLLHSWSAVRFWHRLGELEEGDWAALLRAAEAYFQLELKANMSFHLGICCLQNRLFSRQMMSVFHKLVHGCAVGVGALCKVGGYGDGGATGDQTVFEYPCSDRDAPTAAVAEVIVRRGYKFDLDRSRLFSPYELGTGAHGFYGSRHFVALFHSGGLFKTGRRVVSLENMQYVLRGHENEENILERLVEAGLKPTRGGPGDDVGGLISKGSACGVGGRKRRRGGMLSVLRTHRGLIGEEAPTPLAPSTSTQFVVKIIRRKNNSSIVHYTSTLY